jgi:cytidylate kinase
MSADVTADGAVSSGTSDSVDRLVVAIDGPAGSGKSTVARAVAARLGVGYLDTGAMYRAVAFAALRRGIDPDSADEVARLAKTVTIEVGDQVVVDDVDATIEIRGPEVTRAVSTVAANPAVRDELRRRQREWAVAHDGGVVEGRDIGTVVFPQARLKVYLTAHDDERARRRHKEVSDLNYDGSSPGLAVEPATTVEVVAADLARRDHLDSTRAASPLAVAHDAVVIDTTTRSIEDVVDDLLARMA